MNRLLDMMHANTLRLWWYVHLRRSLGQNAWVVMKYISGKPWWWKGICMHWNILVCVVMWRVLVGGCLACQIFHVFATEGCSFSVGDFGHGDATVDRSLCTLWSSSSSYLFRLCCFCEHFIPQVQGTNWGFAFWILGPRMHASVAMRMKLGVTASALGLIAVVGMSSMRTPLTSLKKLRELQLYQIRGTYLFSTCVSVKNWCHIQWSSF